MTVRRIDPDDVEAVVVSSMIDETFRYYGGPYWNWKYADNGGPPSVILVADHDERVVGCRHFLQLPYSVGKLGYVRGTVMADLLVHPSRRGEGIATQMSREGLAGVTITWPKSAIIVMFTRNLGDYYRGLLGHTRVPADINRWSKRLTWNRQLEKLSVESEQLLEKYPRLATVNHVFRLEIGGSPPLEFQVNSLGFTPSSNTSVPRLVVRYKGSRFGGGSSSGRMVLRGLQDFLVGRLRVSGSWRALGQALSVSGAYRDVLRVLRN